MEVRLLGPLQAVGPAGAAALPSSRQRALIGLLAMTAGTPIPVSRLVTGIWGEDAPRTAVRTLQSHLTRARQELAACGLPDVLVAGRAGYQMSIDVDAVDAHRFDRDVRQARGLIADGDLDTGVAALRDALELWRGEPLQGTELYGWGAAEVARLNEARLCALEDRWDAELRLGRHAAAVDELDHLLALHPGRERLVGLLMLAQYRCGRHAEALTCYARLREHLADALGVDPSPRLQRLHTAMLRRDPDLDIEPAAPAPTTTRPPAELPARVGHFTGRAAELSSLDSVATQDVMVALLCGPAGMGKTALTVEWAHRVAGRYPDGQLFLDLHGHDPAGALSPAEVLGHVLRGLGVPADRVPTDPAEQALLYRTLVHGRRLLVVCDNAGSIEQVLPLVPPTSTGLLVVTSRNALPGLGVRHAVHRVQLDVLDHAEAVTLLVRVLGRDRVDAEPEAAARLVAACGGMPLALRIAAAKLASRPQLGIADLVEDLGAADRLDALSVPGDSAGIRAVFASSFHALSEPAADAFRAIGLHPGPSFAAPLMAAAIGTSPPVGRLVADELATAHITREVASGRFECHDLIRWYARERALAQRPAWRAGTIERVLDWYLGVADAANTVLTPSRTRAEVVLRHGPVEVPFASQPRDVLRFLDAERDNLVPVSRCAVEHGYDTVAWQLAYLLMGFFNSRGHGADLLEICRLGLGAARRLGDRHVTALMRVQVGVACIQVRRYDDAIGELRQALPLMRAAGDRWGEGIVHNNTAVALTMLRRYDEAIAEYESALAVHTARGVPLDMAFALHNLGDTYSRWGRTELALHHLARAAEVARPVGDQRLHASIVQATGAAQLRHGAYPVALELLHGALQLHRDIGDRHRELDTLRDLVVALLAADRVPAAVDLGEQAVRLSRQAADPHREAVARKNLGLAHRRAGSAAEAERQLRLALDLRLRTPDPLEEAELRRALDELAA